jgi:hypothetical protein
MPLSSFFKNRVVSSCVMGVSGTYVLVSSHHSCKFMFRRALAPLFIKFKNCARHEGIALGTVHSWSKKLRTTSPLTTPLIRFSPSCVVQVVHWHPTTYMATHTQSCLNEHPAPKHASSPGTPRNTDGNRHPHLAQCRLPVLQCHDILTNVACRHALCGRCRLKGLRAAVLQVARRKGQFPQEIKVGMHRPGHACVAVVEYL